MGKKLIEVALPLDDINAAAASEKSIRHGHPSTLHLWWSRKPLAVARAVLFASLVDDPGNDADRQELFKIIRELVKWENLNNKEVLAKARAEIEKSTGGELPTVLDPFAGGGTIPLEAQRLGLHAVAADLNPVAVIINKAMIEIPASLAEDSTDKILGSAGIQKLAADIEFYGKKLKDLAYKKIGALYPKIKFGGKDLTVIAWIWARTVTCANPACRCKMPLVNSFTLSTTRKDAHGKITKLGKFLEPVISGKNISYAVRDGDSPREGTVDRNGATCIFCGSHVGLEHVRNESRAGRMGAQLIAIVAEGEHGRVYLPASDEHAQAASVDKPENLPSLPLPEAALGFSVQLYGLTDFNQLFTNRQLTALTTFQDLIDEATAEITNKKYANAIKVYLAFVVSKLASFNSNICTWNDNRDGMRNIFGRPAIPMVWDFAETNPFSKSSGGFEVMIRDLIQAVKTLPASDVGEVHQCNAMTDNNFRNVMVSTDPPYYDNIGYANLSDFFYVWLKRSLKNIYPEIFSEAASPKAEELIAEPTRQGGKLEAREFFELGMERALYQIYKAARADYPITIYYAFKQKLLDGGSTGWETMLNAVIRAGFIIVGTWPLRTERTGRMRDNDSNALSTSIVLACRKRLDKKPCRYERFLVELEAEIAKGLKDLQSANLAPVDMAQAAIGPGMSVYSRYEKVLSQRGALSVGDALIEINKVLEKLLNEQDAGLDAASKFIVKIYEENGFGAGMEAGRADILLKSTNLALEEISAIEAKGGKVRLRRPEELGGVEAGGCYWTMAQKLVYQMRDKKDGGAGAGNEGCGGELAKFTGNTNQLKNFLYRLYKVADDKRWTKESRTYNDLIQSWSGILDKLSEALKPKEEKPVQGTLEGFGEKAKQ